MSVAIVAIDNATGETLARVGLGRLFRRAPRRPGGHDQALRSPGSALKPFIYGLAFEDGLPIPRP
jgi:penicillin-binding protein 1C